MVCNETAEEVEASSRAGLSLYTMGGGRVVALPIFKPLYSASNTNIILTRLGGSSVFYIKKLMMNQIR